MSEPVVVHPPNILDDPVRTALEYLSEGFQIISPDWKYLYVNPAAARHGRRDASALIGTQMVEAYPGINQTALFDVLRRCMEQRTRAVVENEFTFPDGTTQWFELRIRPVPAGICIYSADIEHRKRPQPLLRRILNLFR
jgi:PAS domain S-box-containing protein